MRSIIPEPCSMLDAWLWFYRWVAARWISKCNAAFYFAARFSKLWQRPQSLSAVKCRLFAGPTTAFGKFMNFWANCSSRLYRRPSATRHEFVVGRLPKPAGLHQKAGLYYCIRCKWSFLVCGSQVAVLDEDGSPLGGDGSRRRFATFEEGVRAPYSRPSSRRLL
jgi:hypothetical protein